jgi:RHS repeat-associated protein
VRQQFTQYERDTETMLDFAQARYFAAVQGRFTSADPFLGSGKAANPQTWNRFSYSLNNPLRYLDPSGLLTVGVTTEDEQEQDGQQSQSQTQPQQPVQQPAQPATSVPSPQVPTSVTVNGPQPDTMVNIPVDDKFFTGVGSILQLTIRDQSGRPIPNVTVMESVTPSTTTQNPNPVTSSTGTISDVVGVGQHISTPLTRQQAGSLIVPILATPSTETQTHSMRIISPSSGVMAIATHQRTLSNIDSEGNLRRYVNPSTGRSMSNFTLTVSPVTVTLVPIVMCPRVFR